FFFSSRRRHTRSDRDWSSDVCSSDLALSSWRLDCGCDRVEKGTSKWSCRRDVGRSCSGTIRRRGGPFGRLTEGESTRQCEHQQYLTRGLHTNFLLCSNSRPPTFSRFSPRGSSSCRYQARRVRTCF